jgi:hypothetical protein
MIHRAVADDFVDERLDGVGNGATALPPVAKRIDLPSFRA